MWPFSKIKEQQQTIFIFNQKITEQQKTINDLDEKIKRLVLGEINVEELNVKNNELKRVMMRLLMPLKIQIYLAILLTR